MYWKWCPSLRYWNRQWGWVGQGGQSADSTVNWSQLPKGLASDPSNISYELALAFVKLCHNAPGDKETGALCGRSGASRAWHAVHCGE